MEPNWAWWIDQRAKRTVEKLESHGFRALFVGTKEDAVREILTQTPPQRSIGVGDPSRFDPWESSKDWKNRGIGSWTTGSPGFPEKRLSMFGSRNSFATSF